MFSGPIGVLHVYIKIELSRSTPGNSASKTLFLSIRKANTSFYYRKVIINMKQKLNPIQIEILKIA
jgi:hypothetical protein